MTGLSVGSDGSGVRRGRLRRLWGSCPALGALPAGGRTARGLVVAARHQVQRGSAARPAPSVLALLLLLGLAVALAVAVVGAASAAAGGPIVAAAAGSLAAAGQATGSAADEVSLALWEALLLGLVEGLTEYLPVSSTGHLLATNTLLGLDDTEVSERAIETYVICIQAGAIVAVLFLYWGRVRQMLRGVAGRDEQGRNVVVAVAVAFVPAAVIGLTLGEVVKDELFGIVPVAVAWLVGGVVVVELHRRRWFSVDGVAMEALSVRAALIVGFAQALALWPGVSRSLVTIVAGVAVGLSLRAAVEFSFLLGFVTLTAATVLEAVRNGSELIDTFGWASPSAGLVMAFVSAVAAIRWMVAGLERHGFGVFGWYRVAVGCVALVLVAAGVL